MTDSSSTTSSSSSSSSGAASSASSVTASGSSAAGSSSSAGSSSAMGSGSGGSSSAAGSSSSGGTADVLTLTATAMGGQAALDALMNVRFDSTGSITDNMESFSPTSPPTQVTTYTATIASNFDDRLRLDFSPLALTYFGPANLTYSEVINGQASYVTGQFGYFTHLALPDPTTDVDLPSTHAGSRLREYLLGSPVALVRWALANRALTSMAASEMIDNVNYLVLVLSPADGEPIRLLVDPTTYLPARADTIEDHPLMGDTSYAAVYSDWSAVDGVQVPGTVRWSVDGMVTNTQTRTAHDFDAALAADTFDIPMAFQSTTSPDLFARGRDRSNWYSRFIHHGFPLYDDTTNVMITQLAPGIHHVTGLGHHTLVIEKVDHLVVVEPALDEVRTQAVLTALGQQFPGKPVTHVVITHFHDDHSGGVRGYAAEGATVHVGDEVRSFFNDVMRRPHTQNPDSLETAGTGTMVTVDGVTTAETIDGDILLFPVDTTHADGYIAVYTSGFVFNSDLVNPGFYGMPPFMALPMAQRGFLEDLADAVVAQGAAIPTMNLQIVGGHGFGTLSWQDLQTLIGR